MATLFPFSNIVSKLVVLPCPSGVKSLRERERVRRKNVSARLGERGRGSGGDLLFRDVLQHHVHIQVEALQRAHELPLVLQNDLRSRKGRREEGRSRRQCAGLAKCARAARGLEPRSSARQQTKGSTPTERESVSSSSSAVSFFGSRLTQSFDPMHLSMSSDGSK